MVIEQPSEQQKKDLLSLEQYKRWNEIVEKIENEYDVDQIWCKGFGDWIFE